MAMLLCGCGEGGGCYSWWKIKATYFRAIYFKSSSKFTQKIVEDCFSGSEVSCLDFLTSG